MEVIKTEIREGVKRVLSESFSLSFEDFVIEHPAQEENGDYSSNVAMTLVAQKESLNIGVNNPRELAEKIKEGLENDELLKEKIGRIEVAGPGFINFWLKKEWLIDQLNEVMKKKDNYGRGKWTSGKRILVEYSSPNIAKEFSVGHLRSTIIGQALYNLYSFGGAKVVGDNHLGDWGTQFGMIIAMIEEKEILVEEFKNLKIEELEKMYVEYNQRAKEDESLIEKAREAFARLEQGDSKAREFWEESIKLSMKEFEKIYELLGISIDNAYGESYYEKLMVEVIKEAKEKGVVRESEGALIVEFPDNSKENFDGGEEKMEMPPAILVKSNGTTTYFTRDLATIKFRESQEELKSDLYIYEVGAEQELHFRQVFAAAERLWGVDRNKFKHVAHGLILGEDGRKMSTRRGTGVRMEELITRMINKAGEINPESAKEVGVGAVKFFDLKHLPSTSYRFDWKEALRLDGDSGPYIQYSVVRSKSVLNKGKMELNNKVTTKNLSDEQLALIRLIYRFPEVIEDAASVYAPNVLAEYLLELARRFNTFYNKEQIIGSSEEGFRLLLTASVSQVLENGLGLLGIAVPEKM